MAPPKIEQVRGDVCGLVTSVTVVRVRRRRQLLAGMRHWRRVRRDMLTLAQPPLLARGALSMRTRELTFFSLWPDVRSLLLFNGLASHVNAVRWVIRGHHDTWTGIFGATGRSELSRGSGEPHWLAAFDAHVPAQSRPRRGGADRE